MKLLQMKQEDPAQLIGNIRKRVGFSVRACSVLPIIPGSVGLWQMTIVVSLEHITALVVRRHLVAGHRSLRLRQTLVTMTSFVYLVLLAVRAFFYILNHSTFPG